MLLARIHTSTPHLVLPVKQQLRAAGYLVEIVGPKLTSRLKADLELHVLAVPSSEDGGNNEAGFSIKLYGQQYQQTFSSISELLRPKVSAEKLDTLETANAVERRTPSSILRTGIAWFDRIEDSHAIATTAVLFLIVTVLTLVLWGRQRTAEAESSSISTAEAEQPAYSQTEAAVPKLPKEHAIASPALTDNGSPAAVTPAVILNPVASSSNGPSTSRAHQPAVEEQEVIIRRFNPTRNQPKPGRVRNGVKVFSDLE